MKEPLRHTVVGDRAFVFAFGAVRTAAQPEIRRVLWIEAEQFVEIGDRPVELTVLWR